MKTVVFLCPTMWDASELPRATADGRHRVVPYGTDVGDHPGQFDADAFIDEVMSTFQGRRIDGVAASDDYPASIVAAAVARELGLPGPGPECVLLCQHKYYSRLAQRAAVPEAVPAFTLVDPRDVLEAAGRLTFPVFVKPVKSFLSVLAQPVDTEDDLARVARQAAGHLRDFVRPFNQLLARYTTFPLNGSYLLAEELLGGAQVTVEGCVSRGDVRIIGITDSIMYPGTNSFARFEYPSALPATVRRRMAELAVRLMRAIGFDDALFNVEMFYDAGRDAIHVIEVNPRMCPQFADLMEKVNGVNTYAVALDIATGVRPVIRNGRGRYRVAASFVCRRFQDARVRRVPNGEEVAAFAERFPDARLKVLCHPGGMLSEALQDGQSYRYAILNLGGASRGELRARFEEAVQALPFEFEPACDSGAAATAAA